MLKDHICNECVLSDRTERLASAVPASGLRVTVEVTERSAGILCGKPIKPQRGACAAGRAEQCHGTARTSWSENSEQDKGSLALGAPAGAGGPAQLRPERAQFCGPGSGPPAARRPLERTARHRSFRAHLPGTAGSSQTPWAPLTTPRPPRQEAHGRRSRGAGRAAPSTGGKQKQPESWAYGLCCSCCHPRVSQGKGLQTRQQALWASLPAAPALVPISLPREPGPSRGRGGWTVLSGRQDAEHAHPAHCGGSLLFWEAAPQSLPPLLSALRFVHFPHPPREQGSDGAPGRLPGTRGPALTTAPDAMPSAEPVGGS